MNTQWLVKLTKGAENIFYEFLSKKTIDKDKDKDKDKDIHCCVKDKDIRFCVLLGGLNVP